MSARTVARIIDMVFAASMGFLFGVVAECLGTMRWL